MLVNYLEYLNLPRMMYAALCLNISLSCLLGYNLIADTEVSFVYMLDRIPSKSELVHPLYMIIDVSWDVKQKKKRKKKERKETCTI